jgi:hypothetical protein
LIVRQGTDRVVVNGTGPTLPTTGYTYITWARLIPSTAGFRTLLYTNTTPINKITPITIPNGGSTLGYWDTSFKSSGADVSSSAGIWVQWAVVGTNSSQTFYINGSQVGSTIALRVREELHIGDGEIMMSYPVRLGVMLPTCISTIDNCRFLRSHNNIIS